MNDQNQDIPLLSDVVEPETLPTEPPRLEQKATAAEEAGPLGLPGNPTLVAIIREGVTSQLIRELRPIVQNAIDESIDMALEEARRILHEELDTNLEQRLRELIEEKMEEQFSRPEEDEKI
ncbi:permease [endosymbiont of Riftia pachyptila]|uniref:Uncharacterized protein n=1 Tax=endosymbiont of Riftia pachyptila (vent Ph05) TaxID=1048808 RepID=G2DBH7_9GAMM|nr:permease [endosymbiont of Riftia pachyptila]EGV52043.1 hypothetical protein Rifp1Sym_ar00280 [endosymbiont of Riftia pachyptila (vent Ph05)]